jgi:hypothetical protein
MQATTHQQIVALSKELRLPAIRQQFSEIAQQAASQRLDYEQYTGSSIQLIYTIPMGEFKIPNLLNLAQVV